MSLLVSDNTYKFFYNTTLNLYNIVPTKFNYFIYYTLQSKDLDCQDGLKNRI